MELFSLLNTKRWNALVAIAALRQERHSYEQPEVVLVHPEMEGVQDV